jgi:hypothetical protein
LLELFVGEIAEYLVEAFDHELSGVDYRGGKDLIVWHLISSPVIGATLCDSYRGVKR